MVTNYENSFKIHEFTEVAAWKGKSFTIEPKISMNFTYVPTYTAIFINPKSKQFY